MLPPPTLSFTIPSIHDNSSLDCRIYHPPCLVPTSISQAIPWRKRAAIVAHPYAPLGGSYDDPVVDLVASTVLKQGFVVGTFNFRGAGSSKGHTSWSSLPEQNDYISFIGFIVTYLHHLTVPYSSSAPSFTQSDPQLQDLAPIRSQGPLETTNDSSSGKNTPAGSSPGGFEAQPILLLAGYSYGTLITINLDPSLLAILAPFQQPVSGSPFADIRSRARFLATQQNEVIETAYSLLRAGNHRRGRSLQLGEQMMDHKNRLSSSGVRMGGDEDIRRASHDLHGSGVRRSFSVDAPLKVRKSVDRIKSLVHHGSPKRGWSYTSMPMGQDSDSNAENSDGHTPDRKVESAGSLGDDIKLAYLLISPLPPDGMINNLASIGSFKPNFLFGKQNHKMESDIKFTIDPTLVLYGTGDLFVQAKTFERWTEKLSGICKGREPGNATTFRYEEIANGEHFWRNSTAARELKENIRRFLVKILG
ncbi:8ff88f70-bc29-41f3-9d37-a353152a37b6 [Sclerotinia trifoliorum]|uniref:8ff88f70-bc29-41f3-9d37-a353152a37b6 n=1 Tax=Sclerotinia trifoliorum TaxID=28548 RepID=A0A8H2W267_9HELO|nr:8ff88f70-bc29-41f3-9d37-a353152a37b6 [Sclerotinia trifoliorum]